MCTHNNYWYNAYSSATDVHSQLSLIQCTLIIITDKMIRVELLMCTHNYYQYNAYSSAIDAAWKFSANMDG